MKIHLHSRLYHLIWRLWPKQNATINTYEITYATLPRLLLVGGGEAKQFFTDGMCVAHRPSKSLMIFLSRKEAMSPEFRYTLWHEYLEGLFILDLITEEAWGVRFEEASTLLGPEVIQTLKAASEAKPNDRGHYFALVMELELAKKELPTEQFAELLNDALKNRL
jgi:hypothetical protein